MRQDDVTRAALLLAYLRGEPKAAAALGDFLEEQGEGRVKPHGDRLHRMQAALSRLPPQLAHACACLFAEQALPTFEGLFPEHAEPRSAVQAKRAWLAGQLDDDSLAEARRAAFRLAETIRRAATSDDERVRRWMIRSRYARHSVGDCICQAAGHAASFAVHTTALYAARFTSRARFNSASHRQASAQAELLEAQLATYACAPAS